MISGSQNRSLTPSHRVKSRRFQAGVTQSASFFHVRTDAFVRPAERSSAATSFGTAKTLNRMVVHQPRGLHEGIADGRADEVEAAFLQILAHLVRFRSARRNSLPQPPGVHSRCATDKLPDVAIERAELPLYRQKCSGVLYRRSHLQPIADDPLIA